ncbi:TnsA endonuclease N-terminal domain-containing protein [Photobacterium halotolerans]|uniref:TnsA endonuclease N-terminal domain-containing protein n=1 Tax=Photobacterium halotolerans TaxID=265726 RepID=UPI001372CFEE|nr:TnsA endonuclease N-terminal domain-containing protein [Photobacterium halotolerans]NAW86554.1 endonuclease [Photobacterium halotolerans]
MNQVFTVDSLLEFDACFHLEYSPNIESFETQPVGFVYQCLNRDCPYTPDFKIVEKGITKYIEVKPWKESKESDFQLRFPAKQQKAAELGIPLILITEKQIRVNPVLNNLKLLHRYSGFQSLNLLHTRLLSLVSKIGRVSIHDAGRQLMIENTLILKTALSLVSSGMLSVNLVNEELSMNSVVWGNSCEL